MKATTRTDTKFVGAHIPTWMARELKAHLAIHGMTAQQYFMGVVEREIEMMRRLPHHQSVSDQAKEEGRN